jgi:asparagine synthase (glutamine-hydrolysing)
VCGIAGFVNFERHEEFARAANLLQRHRGPDAQGLWTTAELSLASQRLSIIDLNERSNQPFVKDGLVVVFNGEIYNFRSLKRDLEAAGVSFKTESDTEVVLEAFRVYGQGCLERLKGMFAFAIWNEKARILFLARDAFGIKPLYYYSHGKRFAFASELRTLAHILPVERRIAPTGLAALLNYVWVPPEFCILEGFASVPPGHVMHIDLNGAARIERYWAVTGDGSAQESEAEWVDRLDAVIDESVERHLVADVEVAAFLSGGLDSSLICSLARKKLGSLRTFTIATDEQAKKVERMPSDEIYARKVAALLGTKHTEIVIKPHLVVDLPKMMAAVDEPIGDAATINTWLICAGAREAGVKVLLSGMGADELFFGYRRQKAWLYGQRYRRLPRFVRAFVSLLVGLMPVRIGQRGLRSARWAKKFLSFAELEGAAAYRASFSYFSPEQLAHTLEEQWRAGVGAVLQSFDRVFAEAFPDDPINRLCYTDVQLFLPGLNLAYTDRASMAASTEVRVPFVDRDVVELAMRIPGQLKFKNGRSKYILKRVAERHLPHEIVHRPKASFGAPLRAWISGPLQPMVDDLLATARLKRRGWVDPAECRRMIEADRAGREDHSYQIFQLLVLELWAQATLDRPRFEQVKHGRQFRSRPGNGSTLELGS